MTSPTAREESIPRQLREAASLGRGMTVVSLDHRDRPCDERPGNGRMLPVGPDVCLYLPNGEERGERSAILVAQRAS